MAFLSLCEKRTEYTVQHITTTVSLNQKRDYEKTDHFEN